MVKKLVIIGDSFCHGGGTTTPFKDKENTHYAFGKYLADHLKLEYVNLAEPGISVLKTVELGYDYLEKHANEVELVIAGWTHTTRIGFYSENSMLQVLPNYVLLGNSADTDVCVKHDNNIKFLTDKNNQHYLDTLPVLHKMFIENDFFDSQTKVSETVAAGMKAYFAINKINYIDFNVFKDSTIVTRCPPTFNDVMIPSKHPTKEEQKQFADLFINFLDTYVDLPSN